MCDQEVNLYYAKGPHECQKHYEGLEVGKFKFFIIGFIVKDVEWSS